MVSSNKMDGDSLEAIKEEMGGKEGEGNVVRDIALRQGNRLTLDLAMGNCSMCTMHWYIFILSFQLLDMGSSKKSCSKGILESCGLPGAKRVFAMEY